MPSRIGDLDRLHRTEHLGNKTNHPAGRAPPLIACPFQPAPHLVRHDDHDGQRNNDRQGDWPIDIVENYQPHDWHQPQSPDVNQTIYSKAEHLVDIATKAADRFARRVGQRRRAGVAQDLS